MKKLKFILVFTGICLLLQNSFAGMEVRNSRAYGQALLLPGVFVQSADDKFTGSSGWISGFLNVSNTAIVEFGIDEDMKVSHPDYFKLQLTYDVQLTDASLNVSTLSNQVLEVFYNPAELSNYTDKAQRVFSGYYKVRVFNIRISRCNSAGACYNNQTSQDAYVQVEIATDRSYNFTLGSSFTANQVNSTVNTGNNELTVYWPFYRGAEQYELEYTYVDNYNTGGLTAFMPDASINFDFDHDATKVFTPFNSFIIPLNYERGYILYRVRPITKSGVNGARMEGGFEVVTAQGNLASFKTTYPTHYYQISAALTSENINWEASKTFAENGKFGASVTYMDAMGLSRQSMSRLNTANKLLIGSTVYDHYARPVFKMMPSPFNSLQFNYKTGLNMVNPGSGLVNLDKRVFDICTTNNLCSTSNFPLDSNASAGAAKYYSMANPNKQGAQGFIPDAKGFPYTQVKYLADNTGRITRQSLPGLTHKIGGGHDLQYFYDKPSQVELDRLFGKEADPAAYCTRQYIIDPNGQASGTYFDRFGRVIVKTIAGNAPPGLDNIASPANLSLTDDLSGELDYGTNCITQITPISILTVNEQQTFNLNLIMNEYVAECNIMCLECIYDFKLSITDECGTEFWNPDNNNNTAGVAIDEIIPHTEPYVNTCGQSNPGPCGDCKIASTNGNSLSYSGINVVFPHTGTYYLKKSICVSEAPIESYVEIYKNLPDCHADYCSVLDQQLATVYNAGAYNSCSPPTCTSCEDRLKNYQRTSELGGPFDSQGNPITPGWVPYTPQQYDEEYGKCKLLCPKSECDKLKLKMMMDFYPNTGIFGATDPSDVNWGYSIFNASNALTTAYGGNYFQTPPTLPFVGFQGLSDTAIVGGIKYLPQQLSMTDFVASFKTTWAEAFLPLHPDFCKMNFYCDVLSETLDYDNQMTNTNHYDEACASGVIKPYNVVYSYGPGAPCISLPDPFFTNPGISISTKTAFQNQLTTNFNGSFNNIYKQAAVVVYGSSTPPAFGTDVCTADLLWIEFRDSYLTLKQLYYQQMLMAYLDGTPNCQSPAPPGFVSSYPTFDDSDLLTDYGVNPANATPANQAAFTAQVNANTAVQCSTQCNSYRIIWEGDLLNYCPSYTLESPADQANILNGLEAICNLGCDANHPNGSSSYNPTGPGFTIPSSGGTIAYNFQDILNYYMPGACSANIFSSPVAFSQSNPSSANQLNDCKCNQLLQVEYQFNTALPGTLPTGVDKPWKLFKHQYGFDLMEYNSRLCICKAALTNPSGWSPGYVWTPTEITNITNAGVDIDPRIECSECLKCSDVVTQLNNLYPTLPNQGYPNVYAAIDANLVNANIAENALNNYFNKQYSIYDYLDLYQDCGNFYSTPKTFGNNVTQETVELLEYLGSLVTQTAPGGNTYLNTSHSMKLCNDKDYFFSILYKGALPLPIAPATSGYQYNVSGSNPLTINIDNTNTGLTENTITLYLVSGFWSTVVSLDSIRAYCPSPVTSGGPVYSFIIYAKDVSGNVLQIQGTNTQFKIATLSTSSPFEPMFCDLADVTNPNSCQAAIMQQAMLDAQTTLDLSVEEDMTNFVARYKQVCLESLEETFTRTFNAPDKNFTLFYYDEAGNMVRTVQPKGVDMAFLASVTQPLTIAQQWYPQHSLASSCVDQNYVTKMDYNSYDQPLNQNSVDGGNTKYIYDYFGRIKASQNARQRAEGIAINKGIYSYTNYDNYGRIEEVGEIKTDSTLTQYNVSNGGPWFTIYGLGTKRQVVHTFYDRPVPSSITYGPPVLAQFTGGTQQNTRNRVSYITYEENDDNNLNTYNHASYYSYDQHGNVKEMVEQNNSMEYVSQHLKKIDYEYDLVSGNVNKATYQRGQADQFIHKYYYDPDNRLWEVYTSRDGRNFDKDAKYVYYEHGPLARIERADKQVQGTDYYYTINGWIKGINSDALAVSRDLGKDGAATSAYNSNYNSLHKNFPADAMSYGLNYFKTTGDEDYNSINRWNFTASGTVKENPVSDKSNLQNAAAPFNLVGNVGGGANLFNGNIGSMVTNFIDKDPTNQQVNNQPNPQIAGFRYDMLQRITKMETFRSMSGNTWATSTAGNYDNSYNMNFSYDANGNLLTLTRNGAANSIISGSSLAMDNLVYTLDETAGSGVSYNSNRLACLTDAVANGNYSSDVDGYNNGQGCSSTTRRYDYDPIGNLIRDRAEYIDTVKWTVDGKVQRIVRNAAAMLATGTGPGSVTLPDIEFEYNTLRQRVTKIVKPRKQSNKTLLPSYYWTYTYYVYDAHGIVQAIYDRRSKITNADMNNQNLVFTPGSPAFIKDIVSLSEHPVYGSNRLGVARPVQTMEWSYYYSYCGVGCPTSPLTQDARPFLNTTTPSRSVGFKDLEMSNHLGNVITTVSDRKIQEPSSLATNQCVNYLDMSSTPSGAVVIANNMLYSAGSGLLNCTMQTGTGVSAITIVFGSNITPGTYVIEFDWDPGTVTTSDAFYAVPFDFQTPTSYLGTQMFPTSSVPPAGHYSFLYTPSQTGPTFSTRLLFTTNGSSTHAFKIDNVSMCPLASPPVVNTYTADIESNTDYYAFGQTMPGRTWQGGPAYRFGMNAQLKDNEIYPGAMGAEFWEYDSRIGRRWNVDPIPVPDFSAYSTFLDNPIVHSDLSGASVDDCYTGTPSGWDNFKGAVMGYLQSLPTDPFAYLGGPTQAGSINDPGDPPGFEAAYAAGVANALSSSALFGAGYVKPENYSNNEYKNREFAKGQLTGAIMAEMIGTAEALLGITTVKGAGALAASGVGALASGGVALVGGAMMLHGSLVVSNAISINLAAQTYLINSSFHDGNNSGTESNYNSDGVNDGANLPEIDNSKAASNSRKMSDKEIGEMFGDANWHKSDIKDKLKIKYKKELKGSTNFDFYMDNKTKEIFFKGNKSNAWVRPGIINK